MKKLRIISLVIAIGLVFGVVGSVLAGPVQKIAPKDAAMMARTYDIIFDGFCDGINITGSLKGIVTGVWASSCATCPLNDLLAGTAGYVLGYGPAATLHPQQTHPVDDWIIFDLDGVWEIRYPDGTLLNEGTWTHCASAPTPDAGAPTSFGK